MDTYKLKIVTEKYWVLDRKSDDIDSRLESYICDKKELDGKSLLEAELEYASRQKNRLPNTPCATLVLLVGYSLEPLLQSVCAYKPQKIILIMNEERYGKEEGHVYARHVFEAIGHLKEVGLIEQSPRLLGEAGTDRLGYKTQDNPAAVFKILVGVLHDEKDVVIDVTGGKKSMVTGAFMYAAYANIRISYVDFEEYNPKYRRPYGFTCKIGELSNPYEEFALREWERVRALYERYQFRDAQEQLKSIQGIMKKIVPEIDAPIQKLGAFMEYYEKWDRGDFRGAIEAASNLPDFKQPSAVVELGDQWYEISGNDYAYKPQRLYGDIEALKVYVYDELERIRRLIYHNEDYRSAFLRTGGVNEIVMLARVIRLITGQNDRVLLLDAMDNYTPGAWDVFKALSELNKTQINVKKDIRFTGFKRNDDPEIIISRPSPMTAWWQKTSLFNAAEGWKVFLNRRNELAHKYFSVPQEWAKEALKFVEYNFEDFLGHPVGNLPLCATALPWSELSELCGIRRYLPPNLR